MSARAGLPFHPGPAPAGISFRPAVVHDAEALAALYRHYVLTHTATFETEPPSPIEMNRRRTVIVDAGMPYLVAEHAGQLIGYGYAGSYRPRAAYRFTVEDSIYLDPAWAGRGVGRALLGELIAASEAAGFHQMIAVIGDSANTPSVRLHASLGFTPIGVLRDVGFKFGRWLDTILMQRTLHPPEEVTPP